MWSGRRCCGSKEESSFLKKRSKKLLDPLASAFPEARPKGTKVFWFFFSKKNCFLYLIEGQTDVPAWSDWHRASRRGLSAALAPGVRHA
jgi:hypothetical protein